MLKEIPSEDHLARMYHELSLLGALCAGERKPWPYAPKCAEELFCLAAEMSRHDPRLLSILVRFLFDEWPKLNPQTIRAHYKNMETPQTVAVIAQFLIGRKNIGGEEKFFLEYLQRGIKPARAQFYFHHLYAVGGNMMQRAVDETLKEYGKWGFIAREAPVLDEKSRRPIGTREAKSRKNILFRLLANSKKISLHDYLAAVEHSISRQQALIDIKSIPGIAREGSGRGAVWKIRGSHAE